MIVNCTCVFIISSSCQFDNWKSRKPVRLCSSGWSRRILLTFFNFNAVGMVKLHVRCSILAMQCVLSQWLKRFCYRSVVLSVNVVA
jgi:hypothetical protein